MVRVAAHALGKRYKRYPRRWGRLLEWATANRYCAHHPDWALRDVSFAVDDGESVGVIGMNGAGKSTLLKILTATTQASEGSITVVGRVAALLELGLGMHPEFSGWQNAVLACQLMGLTPAVIDECLPWIQSFSELGDRMEQPVRTYSTGMHLRLAFSTATAVRPDILIVDEALAVGDLYFQHKSMSRIRSFKEQGTTLLFVTHDPVALKALCERAILLDRGMLLHDGPAEAVYNYYNAMIAQKEKDAEIVQLAGGDGRMMTRSGSKEAEIVAVELSDATGQPRRLFEVGEAATLRCEIRINQPMPTPTVGFVIRDRLGRDVFGTNTFHLGVVPRACAPGEALAASFELALNIGPGHYSLSNAIHRGRVHVEGNYDWWDQALVFQVRPNRSFSFDGIAALPTHGTVEPLTGTR
jgi:homopolymeric O-antigen transport system ATP-binding protein